MDFALVIAGLAGLIAGGDLLVKGAVALARRMRISPMVIGLTLVGFGTSAPELVTSLQAAVSGAPGIAVGNVVGSNIANVLLILGVAALIAPVVVTPQALRRDGAVMLGSALALVALARTGWRVGRREGAALALAYAAYTGWLVAGVL